jgi:hypothetical protein
MEDDCHHRELVGIVGSTDNGRQEISPVAPRRRELSFRLACSAGRSPAFVNVILNGVRMASCGCDALTVRNRRCETVICKSCANDTIARRLGRSIWLAMLDTAMFGIDLADLDRWIGLGSWCLASAGHAGRAHSVRMMNRQV